jgi:hypothetical protein
VKEVSFEHVCRCSRLILQKRSKKPTYFGKPENASARTCYSQAAPEGAAVVVTSKACTPAASGHAPPALNCTSSASGVNSSILLHKIQRGAIVYPCAEDSSGQQSAHDRQECTQDPVALGHEQEPASVIFRLQHLRHYHCKCSGARPGCDRIQAYKRGRLRRIFTSSKDAVKQKIAFLPCACTMDISRSPLKQRLKRRC